MVGLAYYDQASGTLYVKGNATCYNYVAKTNSEDAMTLTLNYG